MRCRFVVVLEETSTIVIARAAGGGDGGRAPSSMREFLSNHNVRYERNGHDWVCKPFSTSRNNCYNCCRPSSRASRFSPFNFTESSLVPLTPLYYSRTQDSRSGVFFLCWSCHCSQPFKFVRSCPPPAADRLSSNSRNPLPRSLFLRETQKKTLKISLEHEDCSDSVLPWVVNVSTFRGTLGMPIDSARVHIESY